MGFWDKVRVVRMGIPDRLITHGDAKLLLAKYGLDSDESTACEKVLTFSIAVAQSLNELQLESDSGS